VEMLIFMKRGKKSTMWKNKFREFWSLKFVYGPVCVRKKENTNQNKGFFFLHLLLSSYTL